MPQREPETINGPRFAHVQLSTGVQMHYAEQGEPAGQAVIMLHGYTDSWFSYSMILERLPASVHAYALDLRGHGKSSRPKDRYAMNDLAADVIAFMDAKRITRATIIGHSMGGFVAQCVTLAAPQRVSRLMLVSTATAGRRVAGLQDFKSTLDAFTDSIPAAFVREFQAGSAYAPVPAAFMERAIEASLGMPLPVWRAVANAMAVDDRPARWPRVQIPTWIIWGDHDTYATRAEQDALIKLIPGAVLKAYANTGHSLHWERPDEFTEDVVAFLTSN